jgi:hypothetical protein
VKSGLGFPVKKGLPLLHYTMGSFSMVSFELVKMRKFAGTGYQCSLLLRSSLDTVP